MTKNFTKIKFLTAAIVIAVLVGNIALGVFLNNKKEEKISVVKSTPTITQATVSDYLSYQGQDGKDALTLLKEKIAVEQDGSGLVVSINGRKATSEKREYWAFYVNDKMAEVGPADYKTKNEDKIEWKIEKY